MRQQRLPLPIPSSPVFSYSSSYSLVVIVVIIMVVMIVVVLIIIVLLNSVGSHDSRAGSRQAGSAFGWAAQ
jgi:flagellar basal body-associated protein FliL